MKVITLRHRLKLKEKKGDGEMFFNPAERLIAQDEDAAPIWSSHLLTAMADYSEFAARPPAPEDVAFQNILFSRHKAWGDELMLTAFVRYYHEQLKARCYINCRPPHVDVWKDNPAVTSFVHDPVQLSSVYQRSRLPFYRHAFFFEWLLDGRDENAYDSMYLWAGIDPQTVGPEYKRPQLFISAEERALIRSKFKTPYIIYQANVGMGFGRDLDDDSHISTLFALDHLGVPILVFNSKPVSPIVERCIQASKNIARVGSAPSTRLWFAAIAESLLLVGPDSSGMHAAAGLGIPSVTFWGQLHPDMRAKYYPRNRSIWLNHQCRHAPCNVMHALEMPYHLCPDGKEQKTCQCLKDIPQTTIEKAIAEALFPFSSRGVERHGFIRHDHGKVSAVSGPNF